jgi:Spy/CpxP family protein refolding chaperone
MEMQQAKIASELFQVLTPEQKTKAVQLIQERQQRWQQHMQKQAQPGPASNQ